MLLYENSPSNLEQIETWYPVWYKEVFEMVALWEVWGWQLDEIQAGIIRAVDNNFIDYMDGQHLTKFENWLEIFYDTPQSLAERRRVLKAMLLGQWHIGREEIKAIVEAFTDNEVTVLFIVPGVVRINIAGDLSGFNFENCSMVLNKRIPAHLAIVLNFIEEFNSKAFISGNVFERHTVVLIGEIPTPTRATVFVSGNVFERFAETLTGYAMQNLTYWNDDDTWNDDNTWKEFT